MAFSRLYLPAAGKTQLGKQGCEINWYKEQSGTASESAEREERAHEHIYVIMFWCMVT